MHLRTLALCLLAIMPGARTAAQATAPVSVQYIQLISATNYVQQLRSRKDPVRAEEAITATKLACDGLKQIVFDPVLLEKLSQGAQAGERHDGQNEVLRNNLARFIDEFLRPEIDLLRTAGLSDASIDQIVRDGYELSSHAYIGKYGELSAGIQKNLKIFTGEVCRAADMAKQITATKRLDAFTRLARGLGAATVIVIDASSVTAAPEAMVLAGASLSWGFTALTDAVKTGP